MPVTPVMGVPSTSFETNWGSFYQNSRMYFGPHYASYDFRATEFWVKFNTDSNPSRRFVAHLLDGQSSEVWHTAETTGSDALQWLSWTIDTPVWIIRGKAYYFGFSGHASDAGTATIRGRTNSSLGYTYRRGCSGVPSYPAWGTWGTTSSSSTFGPGLAYVTDGKAIMGALPGGRNAT